MCNLLLGSLGTDVDVAGRLGREARHLAIAGGLRPVAAEAGQGQSWTVSLFPLYRQVCTR